MRKVIKLPYTVPETVEVDKMLNAFLVGCDSAVHYDWIGKYTGKPIDKGLFLQYFPRKEDRESSVWTSSNRHKDSLMYANTVITDATKLSNTQIELTCTVLNTVCGKKCAVANIDDLEVIVYWVDASGYDMDSFGIVPISLTVDRETARFCKSMELAKGSVKIMKIVIENKKDLENV